MRLVGSGGAVWATWYLAASLGSWTLTRTGEQWTLDAEIDTRDDYWIQQPLTRVTVTVAGRVWRWQSSVLHVDGNRVQAVLGSPDHL